MEYIAARVAMMYPFHTPWHEWAYLAVAQLQCTDWCMWAHSVNSFLLEHAGADVRNAFFATCGDALRECGGAHAEAPMRTAVAFALADEGLEMTVLRCALDARGESNDWVDRMVSALENLS